MWCRSHLHVAALGLLAAGAAHAQIPQSQRDALIAFYNSTGGPGWTNSSGWNGAPGTECSWQGVVCDDTQSTVTTLGLSNNNLGGTLPTNTLSMLPDLKFFELYGNHIGGALPTLSGAVALQDLDVSANQFTGSIPALIGLTHLAHFSVDGNQLQGSLPALAGLSSLQSFSASFNQLSGAIPALSGLTELVKYDVSENKLDTMVASLDGLPKLVRFYAFGNQLTGSIPPLSGLASLQEFVVAGNKLSGGIPSISALTLLVTFAVEQNSLSGPMPSISGLTHLEYFDVSSNLLDGVIPALSNLPALKDLELRFNKFSGQMPSPAGLPALQRFDFGDSQLSGPMPSLAGMTALQVFSVEGNKLSGAIPAFDNLPNLTYANLQGNQFDGNFPSLVGAPALQDFSIADNKVQGPLPDLSGFHALHTFQVPFNQLTGPLPKLDGLSQLQKFDAGFNHLQGSISPPQGLTALQEFDVAANELDGTVPDLSGAPALVTFAAYSNKLGGTITSVAGLTQLVDFEVSDNQLTGEIPSLSALTQLEVFQVSGNKLTGHVPVLAGLTQLRVFEVYFNQLDGPLPALSGLSKLERFGAFDNRLSGPIPALTGLSALQRFNVSDNRLTDAIPALTGLTQLFDFEVQDNTLTGQLPDFSGLIALQYFDAHDNDLTGPLPPSLSTLPAIIAFDVDTNRLSGTIPPLTLLKTLALFDVSHNRLTGTLPSLAGLSTLYYFRVGDNQFSGNIPDTPSPSGLAQYNSTLCPNALAPTPNAAWDYATGDAPWYQNCTLDQSSNGAPTNLDSTLIVLSKDGKIRVFQSLQTDLTANTANAGGEDVYSTTADGDPVLESIDSSGNKLIGVASLPAVSPDGNVIAFLFQPGAKSYAKDFVAGQMWAGGRGQPKHQIDIGMSGVPADGSAASAPSLGTHNGTNQLAFCSAATNLVSNDANGARDIFLADPLNANTPLERVSVDGSGAELPGDSCEPRLSGDGTKLVFSLSAAPLFATPARQIVFKDLAASTAAKRVFTGQFLPITTNSSGQGAAADSSEPVVSGDGTVIAFTSAADLDGLGAPIGGREVYFSLKLSNSRLIRRARLRDGTVPDGASQHPQISDDGTAVVMQTAAHNLLVPKMLGKAASPAAPLQCGAVAITTNFLSLNALGGPLCTSDGKTTNQSPSISGDGTTSGFDSNSPQANGNTNRNAFAQGIGVDVGLNQLPANLSGDFSGQWSDRTQDGQGLVLDVFQPDANNSRILLLTWFVAVDGHPTWVQGAGTPVAGSGVDADKIIVQMDQVAIFKGKSFPLGEPAASFELWGSITLTFTDANNGTMSWRSSYPGYKPGSMPIQHFLAVGLPKDDAVSAPVKACASGNWYNPAQNGHGFELEVLPGNVLAVDWFAFAPDGSPVWLQGAGSIVGNTATAQMILISGSGAQFPPDFQSSAITKSLWGTTTFTFADATHASMSWNSTVAGYGSGTQPLQSTFGVSGLTMDRRACQ